MKVKVILLICYLLLVGCEQNELPNELERINVDEINNMKQTEDTVKDRYKRKAIYSNEEYQELMNNWYGISLFENQEYKRIFTYYNIDYGYSFDITEQFYQNIWKGYIGINERTSDDLWVHEISFDIGDMIIDNSIDDTGNSIRENLYSIAVAKTEDFKNYEKNIEDKICCSWIKPKLYEDEQLTIGILNKNLDTYYGVPPEMIPSNLKLNFRKMDKIVGVRDSELITLNDLNLKESTVVSEQSKDSLFVYNNQNYGYSIDIPKIWFENIWAGQIEMVTQSQGFKEDYILHSIKFQLKPMIQELQSLQSKDITSGRKELLNILVIDIEKCEDENSFSQYKDNIIYQTGNYLIVDDTKTENSLYPFLEDLKFTDEEYQKRIKLVK